MWITPRVITFKTEHAPMQKEDFPHVGELFNLPASAPFMSTMWQEIYLHFRHRPEALEKLFAGPELPEVPFSRGTFLQMSRGLHACLSSDDDLRAKINLSRRRMNENVWQRYSPSGTPTSMKGLAWIGEFLRQNRADWMDACQRLSGDPHAVPYVWEDFFTMFDKMSKPVRPPIASAL
mmetsp:Transcript_113346/g.231952  ORF Transcript_113346/g.231952 Transcript_113346/m.231952 type:complete len:178 (-) Transcript_113346:7-540(-)